MGKLSIFQIVVLGTFSILILVGVGIFAAFGGLLGGASVGKVVIWGDIRSEAFTKIIDTMRTSDKSFEQVSYIEKDPSTYESELLNAMASGQAPDLFLISEEQLVSFADKVATIPYGSFSQGSFVSSYIGESQILLTPEGTLGLPFVIDPLVMYWNRDLFASAGLPKAPELWNDFLDIAPKITSLDVGSNVRRSAVALGEWQNINNAKAILSTLFMQAGDAIVVRNQEGALRSVFGTFPDGGSSNHPASSALRFYTEFANPSKSTYSWNRALPPDDEAFSAGVTAVYFGFASEYPDLLRRNPNLSVGVSLMPQLSSGGANLTFGRMQALSVPRAALNQNGALTIAKKLTSPAGVALVSQQLGLPPVRRDVPVDTSGNAAAGVFVASSLIARTWLDPAPAETDALFETMIESVVSGASTPAEAVAEVGSALQQLIGF